MFLNLEDKVQPERKKGLISNIAVLVAVVIFLITVVMTITKMNNPDDSTFFGIKPIIIETGSMEPTIKTNALIIGQKTKFEDLRVGDIITFEMPNGKLNTHRIISKSEGFDMFTTKGDNNVMPDSISITPDNYKYRIITICNWFTELGTVKGVLIYIVLPIIALIIFIAFVRIIFGALRRKGTETERVPAKRRKESQYLDLIAEEHANTSWQDDDFEDENEYEGTIVQTIQPGRERPRFKEKVRDDYDDYAEKRKPAKVKVNEPEPVKVREEPEIRQEKIQPVPVRLPEKKAAKKMVEEESIIEPVIKTKPVREEALMDLMDTEKVKPEEAPVASIKKESDAFRDISTPKRKQRETRETFTGWEKEPERDTQNRRAPATRQQLHKQALAQAFREILNPDEPLYEEKPVPRDDRDRILPREDRRKSSDWRDEIFKDVDLDDLDIRTEKAREKQNYKYSKPNKGYSDIDLSDIDIDDIDLDDIDLDDIDLDDLDF